jgi:hypothetical protein
MMKRILLGAMLLLAGCNETVTSTNEPVAKLPAGLIATTQPADAKGVVAAKTAAKAGDAIVITGTIGGSEQPLADNRAIMTILDASIPTCDKMSEMSCKTPWDACCSTADERMARSATVQVIGTDGKPLKASLKGVGGIAPLKKVVVTGTAKPSGDVLIVDAKQIYVVP